MLGLITGNIIPVYYSIYAIDATIFTQAGEDVWTGTTSTASTAASVKSTIDTQIKEVMEKWQ